MGWGRCWLSLSFLKVRRNGWAGLGGQTCMETDTREKGGNVEYVAAWQGLLICTTAFVLNNSIGHDGLAGSSKVYSSRRPILEMVGVVLEANEWRFKLYASLASPVILPRVRRVTFDRAWTLSHHRFRSVRYRLDHHELKNTKPPNHLPLEAVIFGFTNRRAG